jgi:ribosomal protein L35AE/L33A
MYSTTFLSIPSGSRRGHTIFGNTSTHNSVNSPRHLDSARTERHINNNKNASIQLSRLVLERVLLVSRGAVQELCPQVAFIWLTVDARQAAQSRSCARRSRSSGARRTRGRPRSPGAVPAGRVHLAHGGREAVRARPGAVPAGRVHLAHGGREAVRARQRRPATGRCRGPHAPVWRAAAPTARTPGSPRRAAASSAVRVAIGGWWS